PVVADIGFPPDLLDSQLWLMERADAAARLPSRRADTHKRATGVVLVVAGSRAMTGAPALVARAAYRAGAGLVTVAVPEDILPVVEGLSPECTFLPLPQTEDGTVSESAWPILEERLEGFDTVAVGPGLTTDESTSVLVRRLVAQSPTP